MSELGSLSGNPKTYDIGGLKLNFRPRTLADVDLIFDLSDETKKGKAMKELIARTLKDAVPDASEQEINNVAFRYFKELSEAIADVNGLKQ
jgi:hypothetical protein